MARINTNVSSLIAQHNLAKSNADLQVRLQRLSTGLRINSGADDPAGLIVSERLRSETQGIGTAISNAERATNVIATGEAALSEVSNLLNSIKSLVIESANTGGLSNEEIQANQLQIDDAVASISRIAASTSFAGLKLLNGSLDYVTSGVAASAISDVHIYQANFGTNATFPVSVQVINSAQKGALFLSTGTNTLTSSITIEVAGTKGTQTLQFVSGVALSAVVYAVNSISDSTGIDASLTSGAAGANTSALQFVSSDFGTDAFVSVRKLPGSTGGVFFQTYDDLSGTGNAVQRDTGADVLALVNGNLALGKGTTVKLNGPSLNAEFDLTSAFAQTTGTKSFTITGGGATYQLGPNVQTSQQISFGIQSVDASHLGDAVLGFLSSIVSGGANSLISGNAQGAGDIIDKAISQVAVMRGRLGAFESNTLQTNIRSLQTALENVTSSTSQIRDADFAAETSNMTRAQLLTTVGTTVLATANSNAQNVLRLLQ
ncbi:MAG: flagellin N-terminal helical domain-containing protein [Phycisphaerales bacterium]